MLSAEKKSVKKLDQNICVGHKKMQFNILFEVIKKMLYCSEICFGSKLVWVQFFGVTIFSSKLCFWALKNKLKIEFGDKKAFG